MKGLIKFQRDRGLDKQEFNALNEHANIVEELLESIGLDVPKANRTRLKDAIKLFYGSEIPKQRIAERKYNSVEETPKEKQVDAYCDIITFCTGALLKLGYDPLSAVEECGKEINSRVGTMVDGKFEKDLSDEAQSKWYKADYTNAEL